MASLFAGFDEPNGYLQYNPNFKEVKRQLAASDIKIKGLKDGQPIPLHEFVAFCKVTLPAPDDPEMLGWTWDAQTLIDARNACFPSDRPFINDFDSA